MQTGVGDLVLKLWVRSYPFFGTGHHHGQWGLLWLKLDNVELLPVGQHLVGFLQGGRRQEEREKRDVSEAPNSAGQLLFLQIVYEQMRCAVQNLIKNDFWNIYRAQKTSPDWLIR